MAIKWKTLGLTRKFEIVCLYDDECSSKIEIGKVAWIDFNITYDT
jgi:hypothetical protein